MPSLAPGGAIVPVPSSASLSRPLPASRRSLCTAASAHPAAPESRRACVRKRPPFAGLQSVLCCRISERCLLHASQPGASQSPASSRPAPELLSPRPRPPARGARALEPAGSAERGPSQKLPRQLRLCSEVSGGDAVPRRQRRAFLLANSSSGFARRRSELA